MACFERSIYMDNAWKSDFSKFLIFFQSQDKQSPWFENLPHCCMIYVSVFKLMDLYLSYLMKTNFDEL